MHIAICLGNVGEKYRYTWHNVAWLLADGVVSGGWEFDKYMNAEVALEYGVVWVKPHTMMNQSGEVLAELRKRYEVTSENLFVVHDDLDLAIGEVKISHNRGNGGHNGVASVSRHFGSNQFGRIRIGIAPPGGRAAIKGDFRDYVLRSMDSAARESVPKLSEYLKDMARDLTQQGIDYAMNRWNAS